MQNHKTAGPNNLPMDALKILALKYSALDLDHPNAQPIAFVYHLLCSIWEGAPIPEEWTEGNLSPVFKKGDATDPNNWRPVCLLDCTYKLLATIIANRMNPHVRDDGLEEQCGCLQNKACSDAVFPLKTALQLRKEHNLSSWVVFVDLVKAFDTINHSLMLLVLKKYGFPPKMIETIRKMYEKFTLKFKKGKESVSIEYLTGVHQGDNLAPLLFILVFQAAMESLEETEEMKTIQIPTYKMFPDTAKGKPRGRLIGQNTQAKGTEFSHWISLYVDDSAFILPTRDDAIKTSNLVLKHLKKFGLQMHTGSETKKSKTEVLHIPQKSTTSTPADTSPIDLYDGTRITFTSHFTYLGSIISWDLSDDVDVTNRITKANKAFGSLRLLIFCNPYLPLTLKKYLYMAITVNLLLWGSENWALSSNMQQKLERFHSKSCRAILGINMWEVSMYKVKNWTILARVGVPSMEKIIHYRRLAWMHKIAIMPSNRNPKKFLNAWISSKRPVGRPNITTRDSFLKSLHFCDFKCPNGKLDQWIPEARDYTKWYSMMGKLRDVKTLNEVEFYKTYQ